MPIVDVELVWAKAKPALPDLAQSLADALGEVFGSAPGLTWVKLRYLPASDYAENGVRCQAEDLPVFVTVLLAHLPADMQTQVQALGLAVAGVLQCSPERVHLQYAPAAAGRQAFGGNLVS